VGVLIFSVLDGSRTPTTPGEADEKRLDELKLEMAEHVMSQDAKDVYDQA
jgi:hypothetical protein